MLVPAAAASRLAERFIAEIIEKLGFRLVSGLGPYRSAGDMVIDRIVGVDARAPPPVLAETSSCCVPCRTALFMCCSRVHRPCGEECLTHRYAVGVLGVGEAPDRFSRALEPSEPGQSKLLTRVSLANEE